MATYDKLIDLNTLETFKTKCDNEYIPNTGTKTFYGTCATAAATQAKAIVCPKFTTADKVAGTILYVKFTNAQTYNGAPTINVNSTGALNIRRVGTTNAARYEWVAGETLCFVHDGSAWVLSDGGFATTTYYGATKLATSVTSTSSALALTPASLKYVKDTTIGQNVTIYSASATYSVGDRVLYNYELYDCNTAITTAEAWNADHWTKVNSLQAQIDEKAATNHTHNNYAASSHNHAATDINSGTLDIARIPTGTTATTVALGNHTHSIYAASSHNHSASDINAGTLDIARIPTGNTAITVSLGNHTHSEYAASSHTHGDISSSGDITATAPTIASGDKLIINDESASKITNGPSFGTSTTTYLRNDGTWGTPAGTYTYTHPSYTTITEGFRKVGRDATGHVVSTAAVQKSDITALGIPAQDTTYESKAAASGGTDVSLVTTGEKATWNAKTSNTGTVTSVGGTTGLTGSVTTTGNIKADLVSETKLTNAASAATETSGRVYPVALDKNGKLAVNVPWTDNNTIALTSMTGTLGVDHGGTGATTLTGIIKGNGTSAMSAATASDIVTLLGTTAVNRATADASGNTISSTYMKANLKGAASGVAELDANGFVPSSQLPSYVDDVLEYNGTSNFPVTGETGKIYVDTSANKTYRWSGTTYTEISASLALGTTSSTAFRGDYGNSAYTHAVTNKGSAFSSGLYKITTNAEGHVTAAIAVQKSDITALGIPGSDTNTWNALGGATSSANGTAGYAPAPPKDGYNTKYLRADGTWTVPPNDNTVYTHPTTTAVSAAAVKVGKDSLGHIVLGSALTASDVGAAASTHNHAASNINSGTLDIARIPTGTTSSTVSLGNHSHGDITNGGDITATAPTVTSGDKLVINDESASKITNGPSFGTSTATFLRNDGTWNTPPGNDLRSQIIEETIDLGDEGGAIWYDQVESDYILRGLLPIEHGGTGANNASDVLANIGAAASSHNHAASNINSGTLDIARIPTGTTSSTVALGNHTHSGYAASSHSHSAGDITNGTFEIARIPTGVTSQTVALGNHTHNYLSNTDATILRNNGVSNLFFGSDDAMISESSWNNGSPASHDLIMTVDTGGSSDYDGSSLSFSALDNNSNAFIDVSANDSEGSIISFSADDYVIDNPEAFLAALGISSANGVSF